MPPTVAVRALAVALICLSASAARAEPPEATPNELIVLLAASPGAPRPEEVVERARLKLPLPGGLGVGDPRQVEFALVHRASGRVKALIEADPQSPRARLERYLVLTYPERANLDAIQTALEHNPHVLHVERNYLFEFHVSPSDPLFPPPPCQVGPCFDDPATYQWGSFTLNLPAAWDHAKGHSYVGLLDTGVQRDHEDLQAIDAGGTYLGGNFREHISYDFGDGDAEIDETEGAAIPNAGHGTHVAGLVAATTNNRSVTNEPIGTAGTCWQCSVLMAKITDPLKDFDLRTEKLSNSLKFVVDHGSQVVSMSLGLPLRPCADACGTPTCQKDLCQEGTGNLAMFCSALSVAQERDVILFASSGNRLDDIQFPASDPRVVAVGGIEPGGAFWDRRDDEGCPFSGLSECGSNYTVTACRKQQDLVGPASKVLSTVYTGRDWNEIGCGDSYHPAPGYGLCTGTSMSSPYVAGIGGILRSVNPLLTRGQVRDLLITRSSRADNWDAQLGFGIPNAAGSVQDALGRSGGAVVVNRLTPLFSLYSYNAEDHFYTTFPQMGAAAIWSDGGISGYWKDSGYTNIGPDVAGYGHFPGAGCGASPCLSEPGASVYVFTTDRSPNALPLVPLYRLSYTGPNPNNPGNSYNRDTNYTTEKAGIESFHSVQYKLDGIEGYIYKKCTPEPSCIPAGAVRLYRRYNQQRDDFAIFPESELPAMESQGYTSNGGGMEVLGYVYPNVDTDGDRVVNGFESVLATDPLVADSDCDGLADGVEILDFPYAGKDPRSGPTAIVELANQSISSTQTFEACDTIFAGSNLTIEPSGNVTLHAGQRVVLRSGFRVRSGAVFKASVP